MMVYLMSGYVDHTTTYVHASSLGGGDVIRSSDDEVDPHRLARVALIGTMLLTMFYMIYGTMSYIIGHKLAHSPRIIRMAAHDVAPVLDTIGPTISSPVGSPIPSLPSSPSSSVTTSETSNTDSASTSSSSNNSNNNNNNNNGAAATAATAAASPTNRFYNGEQRPGPRSLTSNFNYYRCWYSSGHPPVTRTNNLSPDEVYAHAYQTPDRFAYQTSMHFAIVMWICGVINLMSSFAPSFFFATFRGSQTMYFACEVMCLILLGAPGPRLCVISEDHGTGDSATSPSSSTPTNNRNGQHIGSRRRRRSPAI
jgi:hypothetical protein